ncbi:MAG: secondary thiamine-phosphate synthase enzyme YjbQ [Bryobacteraceae bacterium]
MRQEQTEFRISSRGPGLYEFTAEVEAWVRRTGIREGLLTLFCQHTSASLLIQENADPDVRTDILRYFARLAPEDPHAYVHTIEGADDMPAHLRTALTQVHLSIPVRAGAPVLGAWQGIYLFEHRRGSHTRRVAAHLLGE